MLAGTTDHRDLSCHLMVCSTIKLGEIFFLKLLLLKHWLVISLLMVSDCLCIIWGAFSFFSSSLIKLSLSSCMSFLTFAFQFAPPSHRAGRGESTQLCGAQLPARVNPTHHLTSTSRLEIHPTWISTGKMLKRSCKKSSEDSRDTGLLCQDLHDLGPTLLCNSLSITANAPSPVTGMEQDCEIGTQTCV